MNRKTGIVLPLHSLFDKVIVNPAFLLEHLQNIGAQEFSQRMDINLWHHIKNTVFPKQSVSQQHMNIGMPAGIVTKRLDSHHRTEIAFLQASRGPEKFKQALVDALTELAE
jgi:hypothetical protein